MGDAIVWAAVISLLSVFSFAKAKDGSGNEVEIPEPLFIDGVVRYESNPHIYISSLLLLTGFPADSRPHPFKCSITPRSQEARNLIQQTVPIASAI